MAQGRLGLIGCMLVVSSVERGGVSVAARAWSNTLALKVTMGQKSQGILKKIQAFLLTQGIHSVIYRPKMGISTLEIGRVDDLTRYLSSVPSIIKRKQVDCALQYLRGRCRETP